MERKGRSIKQGMDSVSESSGTNHVNPNESASIGINKPTERQKRNMREMFRMGPRERGGRTIGR